MIGSLSDVEQIELAHRLTDDPAIARAVWFGWENYGRVEQLLPAGDDWITWLLLAGRGFGKTRTGAETIRALVEDHNGEGLRIALVGPTAADVRGVMVEGESGLMAVHPPGEAPLYEPSNHRIVWKNGSIATCFSADEPQRLRGPQHHFARIAADNSHVPMDAAAMYAFGRAVAAYVSACVLRLRAIKDAIASAPDQAALDAIDVTAGYPQAGA